MSTFVLVHGACHAGWAWRPVAEALRARGHAVFTPTLPGLNTEDDRSTVHLSDTVDYLAEYITERDLHDVVLVGHSWGGFPISGAAMKVADRIDTLVYWSAFVPITGETLIDLCPPAYGEMFRASAAESADNSVMFPYDVFAAAFMQDAAEETLRIFHPLLERQPFHTFDESLDLDGFDRLPVRTAYVLSKDDVSLPPGEFAWAPRFPDRLPGAEITYAPGSHESLLTQPAALADALISAAGR